jgi:hypothetical protein
MNGRTLTAPIIALLALLAALALARIDLGPAPAAAAPAGHAATGIERPRIVRKPIPFPQRRRNEMRAYARRHYGLDTYRIQGPNVIVEHLTAGGTVASAWNSFAVDRRDSELGELPGLCSHFIIGTDGVVYQLVPLRTMCRHTVGLNWTAIGIEHVGFSDAEVMGRPAQLRASLRLTRWLQDRFAIRTRNAIGHAESLSSPYHRERVKRLRKQTHGDFGRATMQRYRHRLGQLPAPPSLRR